jgi:hypothetical protein
MHRPLFNAGSWRGYLLGLATCVFAGVLWQAVSHPPPTYAQVPDSGAQRNRMIQELMTANKKLSEIADLLKQIRDQKKDEPAAKQSRRSAQPQP